MMPLLQGKAIWVGFGAVIAIFLNDRGDRRAGQ
jgi:hypothetical protein